MKKLFLLTVLTLALYLPVIGQSLHIDSTRFVTGNKCCTDIRYSIPTADKGILFVGADNNNPGGIIPYFSIDTSGTEDVFIGKIDSNQKISWLRVYGGSKIDLALGACQSADGGYAIIGLTYSSDGNISTLIGSQDIWLIKLDATGNLLWEKTFGATIDGGAFAYSIANTTDDGFIILGSSNGSGGDIPSHYGSAFTQDWVVLKTDNLGNKEWSRNLGGSSDEQGNGSIIPVNDCYYLIGSSASTDYDCTGAAWHHWPLINEDIHLIKLDATGNTLWDSTYGGSDQDQVYSAIFDLRDSTLLLVGTTTSTDHMVVGALGGGDMWVIKVNRSGQLIWQKPLGTSLSDVAYSICIAPNGGYMIYGATNAETSTSQAMLYLIDNNGNELVNKNFGGANTEKPNSVVPYLNGFAASGLSLSPYFNEGGNYGNLPNGGPYISYIGYWPLISREINKKQAIAIKVLPNPAQNLVSVFLENNYSDGMLEVISSIGKIVYSEIIRAKKDKIEFSVRRWTKGIYLVHFRSQTGMEYTQQLVVN